MNDPRDYFQPYDEPDEDATIAEHHPDLVLPDLVEQGIVATPMEWEPEAGFGTIEMACGCLVDVRPGDTVWMVRGSFSETLLPVAIEPVTLH